MKGEHYNTEVFKCKTFFEYHNIWKNSNMVAEHYAYEF